MPPNHPANIGSSQVTGLGCVRNRDNAAAECHAAVSGDSARSNAIADHEVKGNDGDLAGRGICSETDRISPAPDRAELWNASVKAASGLAAPAPISKL